MKFHHILAISSICWAVSANATNFDTVLNTVVDNNLSLRYNDSERELSLAELRADNILSAPEISFENLWGAGSLGDKRNFSVTQSFDWPGVYKARREIVKDYQAAFSFLHASDIMTVRMDVRLLLIDIIYTRQKIHTASRICDSLKTMSESFKKAVEEGNETRLDYNKSVIELIAAQRELKTLEGELSILYSSLQTMNGGKDISDLVNLIGDEYPESDISSLRPDYETIKNHDPSYNALEASVRTQKSVINLENKSLLPGFSLGYLHEWEMGDVFNGFSVSVSLPFINGRKRVNAAKVKLQSMEWQQDIELMRIYHELMGEYENALALKSVIDQYRDVVCNDSNIALLKKAFDGGQINFLTYMQEVNYFLTAHSDFHETLYRYNVSIAKLQRYK